MPDGQLPDDGPARLGSVSYDDDEELIEEELSPFALEWPGLAPPGLASLGLVNRNESLLPLTAMLRSWEDRFGARLLDVGAADLRLLVERPPRTLEHAQLLAAGQTHLADGCTLGARGVSAIAENLLNAPIWTFWWD